MKRTGKFLGELETKYVDGETWIVEQDNAVFFSFLLSATLKNKYEVITPKAGFETDFASTPRILWRLFPPTGHGKNSAYGKAAVIHDWLYFLGNKTRKECDDIFYIALIAEGIPNWKANIMWAAVRVGGWSAWNDHRRKGHGKNEG
jgi:hypothetical protein